MAYLDKHATLDPVIVSVVSSNPTGGNFLKFFKPLDVNFGLKCKCDLIVKNSSELCVLLDNLISKQVSHQSVTTFGYSQGRRDYQTLFVHYTDTILNAILSIDTPKNAWHNDAHSSIATPCFTFISTNVPE